MNKKTGCAPARGALIAEMRAIHRSIRDDVDARLREFRRIGKSGSGEDIFTELAFCLLTPQSKARSCGRAVDILIADGLLFRGRAEEISAVLNIVRFRNKKADYIVRARDMFFGRGRISIEELVRRDADISRTREWLAENVKGMGFKEASHFLRNIGRGDSLAILDRHILKNLALLGIIDKVPDSLPGKNYIQIEEGMKRFADAIGISMDHLDFVLWYREAGEVFK